MLTQSRRHTIAPRSLGRQRGVILLLIVLSMLAMVGVLFLSALGQSASQRTQVQRVSGAQALVAAKQTLIGYAVSKILPVTNGRLGRLPQPDTLTDGNYDGNSDNSSCLDGNAVNGMPALVLVAAQVANLRCMGRLPWNDLGLSIDGAGDRDVLGVVPWYAVSPNFSDPTAGVGECVTILNAVTMAGSPATFSCPTLTGPAWPWMKVCDSTGRILSSRVAFVLILPGEATTTTGRIQQRTTTATGSNPNGYGNPGDFLDALPKPAGWSSLAPGERCSSFDNANLSGEFIVADRSAIFNDQVLYVTVDELMIELEKRVANEVRESLLTLRQLTGTTYPIAGAFVGSLPWLVPIAIPTNPVDTFVASAGTGAGLVPFHVGGSKFRTEVAWSITGANAFSAATSQPTFNCTVTGFAGTRQCRLRATATTQVPRSANAADIAPYKTSSDTSTNVKCLWDTASPESKAVCDSYLLSTQNNTVSYYIQHRPLTGGGYTNYGNASGTRTRTVTLDINVTAGSVRYRQASSTNHIQRQIVTSLAGNMQVGIRDRWTPGGGAIVLMSATAPSTGTASASNVVNDTVSDLRRYPVLPSWYSTQQWYEQIYAAISADSVPSSGTSPVCSTNCLISGARTNIDALVISTGAPLAAQIRYAGSPIAGSFIESPNSLIAPATSSASRTFAGADQQRTTSYLDSIVTVPR